MAQVKLLRLILCLVSFWFLSNFWGLYSFYTLHFSLVLLIFPLQLCTLTLFHHRLRDSVPWPGQWRKPWSPWGLPLSNRRRQSLARASGKPHRPSLFHAELLLHLLTLIKSDPFPSCSTFHLRDAANGVCPSTCLWDHSPWKSLHPSTLSFYHRP